MGTFANVLSQWVKFFVYVITGVIVSQRSQMLFSSSIALFRRRKRYVENTEK